MTRLTQIGIGGSSYGAFTAKASPPPKLGARYPRQDPQREARIVQDVADLLHESPPSPETERKIKRWIQLVLSDAAERRRWWFLGAVAARVLNGGDDVIDLLGHIDTVSAVWAPTRLALMPLEQLLDLRQDAAARGANNAGEPRRYAVEAGRRIHLWPTPAARIAFAVHYTRPMHPAILPSNWEGIVLDGVLGKYGQHFDRDALTQSPEYFEQRYEARLKRSVVATGHFDLERVDRWMTELATAPGVSIAQLGEATELLVPASVLGIGYQSIDDGYYPLEVA
jgi:hypothetical protein